jgi:TolB-like protein/AraC-like DNA-binding protein
MAEIPPSTSMFVNELTATIEKNISNEQFGVCELADAMNMSRSNLLRKVKKETNLSVTQLISGIRLKRAMELLKTTSLNVSEVSHEVGFGSTSYFIKCFREYYGYPPGETGKRENDKIVGETMLATAAVLKTRRFPLLMGLVLAFVFIVGVATYDFWPVSKNHSVEKSIAVLPFKNESSDSTNVYLINGLMEATLSNLQQIGELKVISRTTAEKYRNTNKSIPEIARELNVTYFIEGSGQKIGDRILLNVQLIDGSNDKHLWGKQYRRETTEIFELQQEIASNIADEIQVIITPEQKQRIEKKPTDDLVAYDYFLKGKDLFYKSQRKYLEASIPWFKKAIEKDPEFSLAFANLAMVYYYLDIFQVEKRYSGDVSFNADKAMLYDPKSGESLVVKGLDYAIKKEYKQAIPYFEKALEYNPSSGLVLHFLNEFYSVYVPNPRKHIEYAIKKLDLDLISSDSATIGFDYFHLSHALFQTGFLDDAVVYINKSLAYNPNGYFTGYFRAYAVNMKSNDLLSMKDMLIKEWKKDTARFDIVQEIGKVCFVMRDYNEAYQYYRRFVQARKRLNLDLYKSEDIRIAIVYDKMGFKEEAAKFMDSFREFANTDLTMYKHLLLCMYYSQQKNQRRALDELALFSKENNVIYPVTCIGDDPLMDPISNLPEFKSTMQIINDKFWKDHKEINKYLKELGFWSRRDVLR